MTDTNEIRDRVFAAYCRADGVRAKVTVRVDEHAAQILARAYRADPAPGSRITTLFGLPATLDPQLPHGDLVFEDEAGAELSRVSLGEQTV